MLRQLFKSHCAPPCAERAGTRGTSLGGTRFESRSRYPQPLLIFLVSLSVLGKFQD